jgi:hypothetical protein
MDRQKRSAAACASNRRVEIIRSGQCCCLAVRAAETNTRAGYAPRNIRAIPARSAAALQARVCNPWLSLARPNSRNSPARRLACRTVVL